jgi:hypothetical protein
VLGVVYRIIVAHLIKKSEQATRTVHTGAVTLIHRFGLALRGWRQCYFHETAIQAV